MGAYGNENGVRFTNYKYWMEIIRELKYPDVTTGIIKEYEKSGSTTKTAEVFMVSKSTIAYKLKAFGYKKLKHRGGNNNPFGRRGKPIVK